MKIILSPTKTFDFSKDVPHFTATVPKFIKEAKEMNEVLKGIDDIATFYKCSDKIATEVEGYINSFESDETRAALFSYSGLVFKNLDSYSLKEDELLFLNQNLFILSGMFGILRPFDTISKYRLEMQQKFTLLKKSNLEKGLYGFWSKKITNTLNEVLDEDEILINLASNEYSKAIDKKLLKTTMITVDFKESVNGKLKTVGTYSKQARGVMLRYIATNKIDTLEGLKQFKESGYAYSEEASKSSSIIFARENK